MERNLKYFMRERKDEIVKAPAPKSFTGEKGEPIELEIRVLSSKEIREINDRYKNRTIALDGKGNPYISNNEVVFKSDNDSARAVRHIIAEALVYPNLKDEKLMEFYGCVDISEMPQLVFSRSDEYSHVNRVVFAALGLTDGNSEDALEEAKN